MVRPVAGRVCVDDAGLVWDDAHVQYASSLDDLFSPAWVLTGLTIWGGAVGLGIAAGLWAGLRKPRATALGSR